MAPLGEKNQWSTTFSDSVSIETAALIVSALGAVASLLLIVFVCACGKDEDKPGPEAEPKAGGQEERKKLVIMMPPEPTEKQDAPNPSQAKKMGGPKHNVPLAPPGHTVPPVYIPDDDDRTVQADMKKSSASGKK